MGCHVLVLIPLVSATLAACSGSHGHHPPTAQSGGSAVGGSAGIAGTGTAGSNGACADVAGTWTMLTNDCGSGDLVIAQDGCNVEGRWFAPLAGTVSGGALTLGAVDGSSLSCRAAVVGNSLSGACATEADLDGNRWECTFEASLSSE